MLPILRRDISAGIGSRIEAGELGFNSRQEQDNCSLLSIVDTGSGACATSYRMGAGDCTPPEIKRQGYEDDDLPTYSAEVKNGGAIPPLHHMPSGYSAQLHN
jgi:hypothetical protein